MIDLETRPPQGFSTGPNYTNCLRIYYLDGWYWVFDQRGYLCRCDTPDDVTDLLRQQSERPQLGEFRPVGARANLFPEWADELEAQALRMRNAVPAVEPKKSINLTDLGL